MSPLQPLEKTTSVESKDAALRSALSRLPSLIVAYSGGVDSAYLALVATQVLGPRVLAITADSPSYPERHRRLAQRIAETCSLNHEIIRTGELARLEYRSNPANRCYYCKHELYTHLTDIARARGFAAVADGSNADDRADYRPGRQAAREFGVISPLDAADLTKHEIRQLAREAGLPSWDEPASACLSSRIPYFSEVTEAKLRDHRRCRKRAARSWVPRLPCEASRVFRSRRGRDRRVGARVRAGGGRGHRS